MLFALVYYAFLSIVYLIRALEQSELELKLAPFFSLLLVPFTSLLALDIFVGQNISKPMTLLPIVIFFIYDLWYRLLSRKKPVHHPKKWPIELVIYLLLLMAGSIGLNWYGYLTSKSHGNVLVAAFFVMMGFFGYYQHRHGKSSPDTHI
ncbi:MAG TPA: hypothetical protein VMS77_07025 [Conexivisphaerales archaeon]|nr:hypothetical protein [Conexivisphaerales archaeon]